VGKSEREKRGSGDKGEQGLTGGDRRGIAGGVLLVGDVGEKGKFVFPSGTAWGEEGNNTQTGKGNHITIQRGKKNKGFGGGGE